MTRLQGYRRVLAEDVRKRLSVGFLEISYFIRHCKFVVAYEKVWHRSLVLSVCKAHVETAVVYDRAPSLESAH